MTSITLFTIGTPNGSWPGLARALLAGIDGAPESQSMPGAEASDAQARIVQDVDTVAELAKAHPKARFLAFVESPSLGLSAALGDGRTDDARQWLETWRAGASSLLRQAQRNPGRFVLVDAAEAGRAPESLAALCRERFGSPVAAPSVDGAATADAICRAIAEAFVQARSDLLALFDELQASCVALDAPPEPPALDGVAVAAALNAFAATKRAAAHLPGLQALVEDQRSELRRLQAELAGKVAELGAARQARDAQARLTTEVEARAAAELAVLRAEATEEREKARREQKLLMEARCGVEEAARQAVAEARDETEQLVAALHEAQEAFEESDARCRRLEDERSAIVHVSPPAAVPALPAAAPAFDRTRHASYPVVVTIKEVRTTTIRDEAPHREATFVLRRIRVDAREVPDATVRLVEHHGHPGLAIFARGRAPQLYERFHESGREGEQAYMLLIPSDAHCQPALKAMNSRDFLLTHAIVTRLEEHLASGAGRLSSRWTTLVRRVREHLLELPRQFRHGSLDIERIAANGSGHAMGYALRFGQVHCGARALQQLTVHWVPAGNGAGLRLRCGDDGNPPLISWPDDTDGALPPEITLPFGERAPNRADAEVWNRLPPEDRAFVAALAAAWPDIVAAMPPSLHDDPQTATQLAMAASVLAQAAIRAAAGSPAGSRLRRLAGQAISRLRPVLAPI
jgi:hypothetical protein